jgi:NAD(P)-dependent dehydrogenase (short-subunit alcohol dehydrogenase family)
VNDPERGLLTAPPSLRLDGRVAWITGASRGLGRAIAFAFAGLGAEVVLCARSADQLEQVAADIRAVGGVAETVVGSVSEPAVIDAAAALIDRRWGKLDVLVNNAGISTSFVRAERLDEADWRETLEVNLTAPFATSRASLPLLERGDRATVINISSVHGVRAHERLIAYAASKGGLEMLTRTLAVEWAARNIRVNAVAPGYIETDMTAALRESDRWAEALRDRTPVGRFATTAEIVPSVALLAARDSTYTTGATLYVDGGWTAL